MQIQNSSNTNFNGAFVLKPKNEQVCEAVPNLLKKGKQIFYDIKTKGDIVIVTRDKYDKKIADFIEAENLQFEYYPEISTSSGLDDEIPDGLKKLMRSKKNCVIKNLDLLKTFLTERCIHLGKQSEYLQEAINTLRLNVENLRIEIDSSRALVVRDETKKRTIKSSGFKNGISYVYVRPDSPNQDARRVIIGRNGHQIIKEFTTPNEMIAFSKAFNSHIKAE